MRIKNIDGLSANDLQQAVNNGGRFVYYPYTVSLVFVTMRRTSDVYLVKAGGSNVRNIPYILISALFGWWGFPFGPMYTLQSLRANFRGGKDVTEDVMETVEGFLLFKEVEKEKASG